jgi:hypothetical protein
METVFMTLEAGTANMMAFPDSKTGSLFFNIPAPGIRRHPLWTPASPNRWHRGSGTI